MKKTNRVKSLRSVVKTEKRLVTPKTWNFECLSNLSVFWISLRSALLHKSPSKVIYEWSPVSWWNLGDRRAVQNFLKQLTIDNGTVYAAIGNKNLPAPKSKNFHCFYNRGKFSGDLNRCYSIIDGWLISITLPQHIARRIKSTNTNISMIMNAPCRASVTLERNTKNELKLRRRFHDHFWSVAWANL